MTYNSRRGILGAIPIEQNIAYHLFSIDSGASKFRGDTVKLRRKSKWHPQHKPSDYCNEA